MPPLATAALLALVVVTARQQSAPPAALPSGVEFPPQDALVWMSERQGLVAGLAARRLTEMPDSPELVRSLAQAKNLDGMLRTLRLIVGTQPRRIAPAFEAAGDSLWQFRGDDEQARRNGETLRQIVALARERLPDVPREEAARAERMFIIVDGESSIDRRTKWADRLARFIEQYRGTEAAVLAEVDAIVGGGVSQKTFDALDAFIETHPGTTAAAKALYQKGFQWHTINTLGTLEPRNADPTNRFMRVLAIVKELESGKYPRSEWVEKAPSLITGFFLTREVKIAPENIDRLLDAWLEFGATHFRLDDDWPARGGIGYLMTTKAAELYERKGERVAGVERLLEALERRVTDRAAVRYLRALFYLEPAREQSSEDRKIMLAKAREVLTGLSAEGVQLYHRKALATLASLEFAENQYAAARAAFRKYASSYPESSWTWVARLRAGQCEEELGNPTAAAAAYLDAAARHANLPLARVLGHEYAARAYEAAGELDKAFAEHQRALAAWDNKFGLRYSTYVRRTPKAQDPFVPSTDVAEVTKESLAPRIAQLKRSLAMPGGAGLERGRVLLAGGRQQEALQELQRVESQYGRSPAATEARSLARRARLERALQLADVERADADEGAAIKELEAILRDPHDFAVTAAGIAYASLLWKQGQSEPAEKAMREGLTAWHAAQRFTIPSAGLEQDVAEIRRAVFLPEGGDIYRAGRWNAFSFSGSGAPFALVNTDVRVREHDGEVTQVSLVQEFPLTLKVLFFDTGQIAFLKNTIMKLGGTRRREPRQVMETPNQPVGDSMQILRLWNKFFPARPGHWGGWEVETYPVITEIHFTDADRTKAAAKVTIGYSGATVELEKEAGRWIPKRLTNQWIT